MSTMIRELCALSILFGVIMGIIPEGGVKRITGILCSAILIIVVLAPIKSIDIDSYALLLTQYREQEAQLTARADEINSRLNRAVIVEEYEAYIMDKAEELGIDVKEARVEVQWSTEAVWVPYSVSVTANADISLRRVFEDKLMAELGIPQERVKWQSDE